MPGWNSWPLTADAPRLALTKRAGVRIDARERPLSDVERWTASCRCRWPSTRSRRDCQPDRRPRPCGRVAEGSTTDGECECPAETADAFSELSAVIGPGPHTRAEATSKLWSYIKQNGCQNPENRREVIADSKLQPVFGGAAKATMFEVPKHLNRHLA